MMKSKTVTVKRHSLLYRILHWMIVLQVILLLLSGLGVSDYLPLALLSRGAARNLHVVLGLGWAGTITFFIYYFIVSGEYKWFGVSRIGSSFDFFMHEVRCFVTGKKMEHPVAYNAEKKKYVEKIVPTEVLAWWGWFGLWSLMILTGLAMLFPASFSLVNSFCQAILPRYNDAVAATRMVHLSISMIIIVYIMIHAYASWTFGMVGSMFSGVNEEPVINSDNR